jgi:hypothetical protein
MQNHKRLAFDMQNNKGERGRRSLWARLHSLVAGAAAEAGAPFEFKSLPKHEAAELAVGCSVRLADGLKIVRQYGRFLTGAARSWRAERAADWFEDGPLVVDASLDSTYARHLELFGRVVDKPGFGELCYELHQTVPCTDRGLTRHLLSLCFPSAREYEVDVALGLARLGGGFAEFKNRFECWRGRGLVGVLLAACQRMPGASSWGTEDPHFVEALRAVAACRSEVELEAALHLFVGCLDWEAPEGRGVMAQLEALAVAMGVKSNGPEFDLSRALKKFPDFTQKNEAHEIWTQARGALEECFPPGSLLVGSKRASWGLACLTPVYQRGVLSVAERSLEWLEPQALAPAPTRVQDVVSRLGAILLSPEFGHLMMLAMPGRETLADGVAKPITAGEREVCATPRLLLHFMAAPGRLLSEPEDIVGLQAALEARMPRTLIGGPARLLAWRVDPPRSVVLYGGPVIAPGEPVGPPHLLKKLLVDERTAARPFGAIEALPTPPHDIPGLLARRLAYHAQNSWEWPGVIMEATGVHTALMEGLACFCLSRPQLHTEVRLHASPKWDNAHEDARYAETQLGANGRRYREWVSVSAGSPAQKVRLEAHLVEAKTTHWTQFAWRRADDSIDWVRVCSSVPPGGLIVLKERVWPDASPPPASVRRDLHALLLSVKAKYLQNLGLLPMRVPNQRVEPTSTSVYTDEPAGQVLLCYAPVGGETLEFMAFELAPP